MQVECPDISEIMVTGFIPGKCMYSSSLELEDEPLPAIEENGSVLEIVFEGEDRRAFSFPIKEEDDLSPASEDGDEKTDSGTALSEESEPEER